MLLLSFGCHLWASESLGWLRCIPLQLVLVAVAVEMSVAQMLTLHLNFVKVPVAVASGADSFFHLPCSGCCLEVSQPRF